MGNFATINGATILTVPANRIWFGLVTLCATVTGHAGDPSMTAHPSVTVSGTGADDWSTGDTAIALALALPAVGLTSLVGSATSASLSLAIKIHARANPISLILNLPARVTGNALAAGEMI